MSNVHALRILQCPWSTIASLEFDMIFLQGNLCLLSTQPGASDIAIHHTQFGKTCGQLSPLSTFDIPTNSLDVKSEGWITPISGISWYILGTIKFEYIFKI